MAIGSLWRFSTKIFLIQLNVVLVMAREVQLQALLLESDSAVIKGIELDLVTTLVDSPSCISKC